MRKIFTFLCAALMSVGMCATTVVTITDSDFPAFESSFTKDGVTVSAYAIDGMQGNISGPGSFSTTLGNFTKIELSAESISVSGDGWSGSTWTGNASSVSFTGSINGYEEGTTLKFTIEDATPEPEPQGETITVTWNSYDLPSSGSWFTKDGVTLTCDIDDDLYGPGTFTTDLGNFTQIVVSGEEACYIDATDGWSGNYDQKTWTGNAAIVPFDGSIYAFSSDVTIVFTIEPSGGETAVDNIQIDKAQSTKLIRNGMLLIERNGKLFNLTGAQVK